MVKGKKLKPKAWQKTNIETLFEKSIGTKLILYYTYMQ